MCYEVFIGEISALAEERLVFHPGKEIDDKVSQSGGGKYPALGDLFQTVTSHLFSVQASLATERHLGQQQRQILAQGHEGFYCAGSFCIG